MKEIIKDNRLFFEIDLCNYNNYIWNEKRKEQYIKYYDINKRDNFKLFYNILNNLLSKINFKLKYKTGQHRSDKSKILLLQGNIINFKRKIECMI